METGIPRIDLGSVDDILDATEEQRGVLISVLQKVQERMGFLPEAAMRAIAERLGLSLANVYGVASFYKHFHFSPGTRRPSRG